MAHLKGPLTWLAATAMACGAIGLAYLPPRGVSRDPRSPLSGMMTGAPTIERQRANALAKEWRRAALAVRLSEWRAALAPELNRRRAADKTTLVLSLDTTWTPAVRGRVARALEGTWQALGLGTTQIGVAVIVERDPATPALPFRPAATSYLLPDSLDRHTCVAWAAPSRFNQHVFSDSSDRYTRELNGWARTVIGPCVFFASFGKPSPTVERWLASRTYRFAQHVAWDLQQSSARPWYLDVQAFQNRERLRSWLYQTFPPVVLGCMAERTASCRSAALGTRGETGSSNLVAGTSEQGRFLAGDLTGASILLSDMVREFGRARFARFWTSDLPVDSAFHVAMDTTLGDWVLSRQRAYGTTLVVGPAAPLGASAISLGVAVLALVLAVAAAVRRQVA